MKHGKGKFTWKNGATYEGQWRNDHANGEGMFTFNNATYQGFFEND